MKNGILLLSAFVLMLSTITAQVGGAAGGGATPTTQGGTPSQKPATGSDSKTTDKKMVGGSGPSTDKKAIGTGPKCCGRLLINRPGTTAASQATVLAESLLAGKNAEGVDLTFDMLDPNNKPVDKKLWKVAENTAGELVLDASKAPVLAKGKFYMLRVKYGAKYMDYKL
ncbi:MAG: hypothetical protein LKG19_10810 [Saprospiraceae bacterium]|jgi:hypothetical protein|nr:hypothetical protein [Saprospiraceae bacterium]MCI1267052.1 hypothetical protein [Saprospiraceae bacterium]